MTTSETIDMIAEALSAAQGEMGNAKMSRTNPFYKSKYATLSDVWDVCRPILPKHGLAIVQDAAVGEGGVIVTTILAHKSGQFFRSELALKPEKATPQSIGSAVTYGRRYLLSAMTGIAAEEDDDANFTIDKDKKKPPKEEPKEEKQTGDYEHRYTTDELAAESLRGAKKLHKLKAVNDMEYAQMVDMIDKGVRKELVKLMKSLAKRIPAADKEAAPLTGVVTDDKDAGLF